MLELLALLKFRKPFGNLSEAFKIIISISYTTDDDYKITEQHHRNSKRR